MKILKRFTPFTLFLSILLAIGIYLIAAGVVYDEPIFIFIGSIMAGAYPPLSRIGLVER